MKKKGVLSRRGVHVGIVITLVLAVYGFSTVVPVIYNQERGWSTIWELARGDGNPGAGASGVLQIYVYPHQAVPGTAYASNLSTATAFAWGDNLNQQLPNGGTSVPFDTAFDLVVKVRANQTHAWNTSSSQWMMTWIRAYMTCADLSVAGDTECVETQIATANDYVWTHYYLQDADGGAGNGFTISHGEKVNVTNFKFQAFF